MPVPSTIADLSTTAGSNYPQGTDTPTTGDDVLRAYGSFIATLRDLTNGTTSGPTLKDAVFTGTTTGLRTPLVVYKTATTSRASTTTLADDPHLVVALTSGTWMFECYTPIWATTSGAGGLKTFFAYSGTTTSSSWAAGGLLGGAVTASLPKTVNVDSFINISIDTATGLPGANWLKSSGFITTTTSGNLSLQWAQNGSNVNAANIGQGAWISCTKVS